MLIGDFRKNYFPDLLTFLHSAKKTGRLSVVHGTINKQIVFRLGFPVQIDSTHPSDRFSRFLVEQGMITGEEEKRLLRIQSSQEFSLDHILLRDGLISPEDHRAQRQKYTAHLLYPLFAATEGTYRFEEGQTGPPVPGEYLDFPALLIHGFRRIQDARLLTAMYGNPGQIPLLTVLPEEEVTSLFTDYEQAIIDQIDGARTVKQISYVTGLELPVVVKTVLILSYLGSVSDKIDLGVEAPGVEETRDVALDANIDSLAAALPEAMAGARFSPQDGESGAPKQQWIRSLLGGIDKESLSQGEAAPEGSVMPQHGATPVGGQAFGEVPDLSAQERPIDDKESGSTQKIEIAGHRRRWKVGALLVVLGLGIGAVLFLLDMDRGRMGFRSKEDRFSMPKLKVRGSGTPSENFEEVLPQSIAADAKVRDILRVPEQAKRAQLATDDMGEEATGNDDGSGKDPSKAPADEAGQSAGSSGLVAGFAESYVGSADGDEETLRSPGKAAAPPADAIPETELEGERRSLARVKGIHHRVEQDHERIVVDLEGPISFKKYELPEQNIVYIALRQSTVPRRLLDGVVHVSSGMVKTMRLGQFTPQVSRLVITLEKMVNVSVIAVSDPDRIVVVLTDKDKGV